jgi:hypothetical protein
MFSVQSAEAAVAPSSPAAHTHSLRIINISPGGIHIYRASLETVSSNHVVLPEFIDANEF